MDKAASTRLFWLLFGFGLLFFGISRWLLQTQLAPSFDPDTYKYLSGAYARWQDQPLPAIFTTGTRMDTALHIVPGYPWLLATLWKTVGQVSLSAVVGFQSAIALLGYSALGWLIGRWLGRWYGLGAWWVLLTAPALAWLEHTIMPEALTMPLLFIGMLGCWLWRPITLAWPMAVGAMIIGSLMALEVLLRTSSQVFIPILPLLAYLLRHGKKPFIAWLAAFVLGFGATLTPWMLHNATYHDTFRVSASTGRNLYFSAVWSNTIDNAAYLQRHGLPPATPIMAPYLITEHQFQRLVQTETGIAQADAKMLILALEAYRQQAWTTTLQQRWQLFQSLFSPEADTRNRLWPLDLLPDYYLDNFWFSPAARQWGIQQFDLLLPEDFWQQLQPPHSDSALAKNLVKQWITVLLLDGMPLLIAYLLALLALMAWLQGIQRGLVFITIILSPALFMAVYSLMGAPLYRYQIELHPGMLLTVTLALMHCGWRFYNILRFPARSA